MGAYKTLITFLSKVDMEETLKEGGNLLEEYFVEIRMWSAEEIHQTRRVWVECFGIPLQAWSKENLIRIVEQWGTVVCFDVKTSTRSCFWSAKF